jgi:hypothetical protein
MAAIPMRQPDSTALNAFLTAWTRSLISRRAPPVVSSAQPTDPLAAGPNPATGSDGNQTTTMLDLIFSILSIAFFAVCVAYARFCEKVR